MKIKKNRIHILRSLHVVARIRQENALSSEEFATRVRDVYARHHMLSHAPAEETVRAYLKGTRPIPFEPASPGALSYLLAIELAFPGTQAYFFHPLFNLLGPIRTSADRQAKLLLVRQTTIDMYRHQGEFEMAEACEQHNIELLARAKDKKPASERPTTLQWVHESLFSIARPARDILFIHGGLGFPRRRYGHAEDEVAELVELGGLDALAGVVGLFLEGREVDDLPKMLMAREAAVHILNELSTDAIVGKIHSALSKSVNVRMQDAMIRGINPLDALCTQYPQTWRVALHAFD